MLGRAPGIPGTLQRQLACPSHRTVQIRVQGFTGFTVAFESRTSPTKLSGSGSSPFLDRLALAKFGTKVHFGYTREITPFWRVFGVWENPKQVCVWIEPTVSTSSFNTVWAWFWIRSWHLISFPKKSQTEHTHTT